MSARSRSSRKSARTYWTSAVSSRIGHIQAVLPSSDADLVAASSRKTVEQEIEEAHLAVCAMRTRRNALVPVFVLPPEVLSRIFELHALHVPPGSENAYIQARGKVPPLGWIASTTHVCHHWREVALGNPGLWGGISFSIGKEWTGEMIVRSKAAPISVTQEFQTRSRAPPGVRARPPRALPHPIFPSHLSRVQKLILTGELEEILPNLTRPAPILETLQLSTYASRSRKITFSEDLFKGDTPRLHEIKLENVAFTSWRCFPTGNLTVLELVFPASPRTADRRVADSMPPSRSFDAFLDLIDETPSLTRLVLQFCVPSGAPSPSADRTVSLPNLSLLALEGTAVDVFGVLKRLKIPRKARLRMTCTSTDSTGSECCIVLPLIATHLGTHSSRPTSFQALSIQSRGPACLVWAYKNHDANDEDDEDDQDGFDFLGGEHEPDIRLRFEYSHWKLQASVIQGVCAAFHLSDLRALDLSVNRSDWTEAQWLDVFGQCKSVQHLQVSGDMAETSFSALAKWPASGTRSERTGKKKAQVQEPLLFPRLCTLSVHTVDFVRGRGNSSNALHPSLKKRHAKKLGLRLLKIQHCALNEAVLEDYQDIVGNLCWDSMGEDEDEEEEEDEDGW
ncbi:hypothetical protein BV25DRAFT_1992767 [Artomyces pyxidatus]|uniref:Uncharacterized protein n=1 Tax=Artomyces pyxidatus TaxID=48021 RepID=A0ACB8SWT0_9AGAM|nr:hypothetical protein BV25DRAFT_1992767 [Artomyces pyxidatus]